MNAWWLLLLIPAGTVLVTMAAIAIWYVIAAWRLKRDVKRWREEDEQRR